MKLHEITITMECPDTWDEDKLDTVCEYLGWTDWKGLTEATLISTGMPEEDYSQISISVRD